MRQDLASCIVFPDVSESFLGILPEPPEHSLPVGFLLFMSVLWHTCYCLGLVGFVAVCPIVVHIYVSYREGTAANKVQRCESYRGSPSPPPSWGGRYRGTAWH